MIMSQLRGIDTTADRILGASAEETELTIITNKIEDTICKAISNADQTQPSLNEMTSYLRNSVLEVITGTATIQHFGDDAARIFTCAPGRWQSMAGRLWQQTPQGDDAKKLYDLLQKIERASDAYRRGGSNTPARRVNGDIKSTIVKFISWFTRPRP
jgi:hypothetical protein